MTFASLFHRTGPLLLCLWLATCTQAAESRSPGSLPGDRMLARYFEDETKSLAARGLAEIHSPEDWERLLPTYRRQLQEMLGLDPLPPRENLQATVTGRIERDDVVVEKLHFQSLPRLYVTANLYRPRQQTAPAPAILYLCGHGPVISNGVSYGNKVSYQHHGIWLARNGYVCLVLDTLQLGEIQGLHHGTYQEGMWWWNSRGYTPAGVEAWNAIRGLDYLQSRPEVDATRLGATGRSGGGAYSWWVAALDERVRAVAPVAGITDLQNHVVDGTVEGHCDCMFMVNTYRWDYPQVAALVAPRPLLIVNTDADGIFPLDGVVRTHAQVRRIYRLLHVPEALGLVIGPGPHKDTQDLQVPVLRWFNKHLKGSDPIVETAAVKWFAPAELKVFQTLPEDAMNTNVQSWFVRGAAPPPAINDAGQWRDLSKHWQGELREKVFGAWPAPEPALAMEKRFEATRDGVHLEGWDFTSQAGVRLRVYLSYAEGRAASRGISLRVLGGDDGEREDSFHHWVGTWRGVFGAELTEELEAGQGGAAVPEAFAAVRRDLLADGRVRAWTAPRGFGLSAWSAAAQPQAQAQARAQTQIRRRFMLLGATLEGMRVYDLHRAVRALRALPGLGELQLMVEARGELACDALYAALFEPEIRALDLSRLPASHRVGPDYLNVLRVLDVPQVVAMVAEKARVRLQQTAPDAWSYGRQVGKQLGWDADRLTH